MDAKAKQSTTDPPSAVEAEVPPPPADPEVSSEEQHKHGKEMDLGDMMSNEKLTDDSPIPETEFLTEALRDDGEEGPSESQVGEGGNNIGRWSQQEHNQFLKGLELYGKDWRKISTIVPTRTLIQIRTHAQKYFQKNDFGMKYDRAVDGGESSNEKRRFGGKKTKGRNHGRSNYQSTSKVSNHPTHIIMTRSRAPSPIPEDKSIPDAESETEAPVPSIPPEFDPDEESDQHVLESIPRHYNHFIRPSSMPLCTDDLFSRRITPLGVYYPKDRLKQERQFANCVLELIEKKAFQEREKKVSIADALLPPPSNVSFVMGDVVLKGDGVKGDGVLKGGDGILKGDGVVKSIDKEILTGMNKEILEDSDKGAMKDKKSLKDNEVLEENPDEKQSSNHTISKNPPESTSQQNLFPTELRIPPNKPRLRIKNPDAILPLKSEEEDYRADLNAPKTPANVRGNRSILHKAILSSEKDTRAFLDSHKDNPSAITYYVNQADIHGFTPLMTAVCLADPVLAMNLSRLLIENGADLSTPDREGNTALMWTAIVGNPAILRYLLERGGAADDQNDDGNSALHLSLYEMREECVMILLKEAKCSISIRNKQHQTALDLLNSENCRFVHDTKKHIRQTIYELHPELRTLVVHHPDCNLHIPRTNGSQGTNPWEAPPRIDAILGELHTQFEDWALVYDTHFPPATNQQILRAHSSRYVKLLNELNNTLEKDQSVAFTPHVQHGFGVPSDKIKDEGICDTSFSKGSLQAAMRAAGGAIYGVDQVMQGKYRNAFVCVRPPGHHAGIDGLLTTASSCGFCIFNNVMIAAFHALETYPDQIRKIAIVDIDIHHGNGTEQILRKYNHPEKILFWSSHIYFTDPHHEYEFYPGTGQSDFIGDNIYNQPLQPLWETEHNRRHDGEGGRVLFRKAITSRLLPLLRSFSPDLIIMSSGFDGGYGDVGNYRHVPTVQIGMNLKIEDYEWALHQILQLAAYSCDGRVISMLEGGYGSYEKRKSDGEVVLMRSSLAKNVAGHMHGMLGECEEEKDQKKGHSSKSDSYCGCGQIKDEKMIECASGRKCGGWVHFSCAGIDFEDYCEDKSDPFICKWCRAEGVDLNEKKKEVKAEKVKKEEEQHVVTRARTRQKKDADSSYYGGYKRDVSDEEEPRRKTRKRARYSGYGNANKESMLVDEDYRQ